MTIFNTGPGSWTPPDQEKPKRKREKRKLTGECRPGKLRPLLRPWPEDQPCCAGCHRYTIPPIGRFLQPDGSKPWFCRRCLQTRYREMWAKGIRKRRKRRED